jgi:predicted chitinase
MTTQSKPEPPTIRFAFPFRDAKGKEIVDEHVFYDWLANEGSGSFAVSSSGMWHGGIHVSASGAGQHLDLEYGVRSIAIGEIVAFRANSIALASQIAAGGRKPAQTGHYSSAFTLVRHTLEYPANNRLTFFCLYMHLQSVAEYQQKGIAAPAYWIRSYEVTKHAADKPKAAAHQHPAPAGQVGLNIHAEVGSATILGILPHGARVRIDEKSKDGRWGRIEVIESGTPMPPQAASFVRAGADKGWVYLGKERGHLLLEAVVSDAQCDRVIVPATPIPINAGDLIGHLGQYWQPDEPAQEHRMVHIEVFCGDELSDFLAGSRAAAKKIFDFDQLPLLRIDKGVKLFEEPSIDKEGANASETAVVQIYSQAALDALPAKSKGPKDDAYGAGQPWWWVTSANSRYEDISGWVRNRQMPPDGGVTRESPHAWKDFETITGSDAGNPTIFATVDAWLDHVLYENKPATGAIGKLKPLACNVYRALSPMRNEAQAADEMRALKGRKWLAFRTSRLIPKHRSEWASQSEYQDFFQKVWERVTKEPYHDAEVERLKQLVWWDEVRKAVKGPFPSSPDVFHIHPIALVGNFPWLSGKISVEMLQRIFDQAPAEQLKIVADELSSRLVDYKLDSALRLSHFFAQIRQEAGRQLNTSENLNYRSDILVQKFSYFSVNPGEANLYGRTAAHPAQPEAIANRAYGNKIGNGSIESGDGWKYRGRGLKQLTGRSNYAGFQSFYSSLWPNDGVDFIDSPDLVSEIRYAVRSAIYFWISRGLPVIANEGPTDAVVDKITAIINRHTDSYKARRENFRFIWDGRMFDEFE